MRLARLAASAGGIGYFPWAPGTAGSLAAGLVGWLILAKLGWIWLAVAAVVVTVAGVYAIHRAEVRDDPGWVVIDEVAGQWITLLGLREATPLWVLAAFLIFRLLDITKPGPIGWADRQDSATGIMADDVVAGVIGAVLLWVAGIVIR